MGDGDCHNEWMQLTQTHCSILVPLKEKQLHIMCLLTENRKCTTFQCCLNKMNTNLINPRPNYQFIGK